MKHAALVLALLGILGVVAAQIPLTPPAYYGAPSTSKKKSLSRRGTAPAYYGAPSKPKRRLLGRRGTGPRVARAYSVNVVGVEKPKPADAKASEEQLEQMPVLYY
ncbi:hypothetical protein LZ30DRAFT_41028 [Colletotrichum cereale]|nr:hypothetical protein LZ30DRAFT_41028 [Colletotrichum cereale]